MDFEKLVTLAACAQWVIGLGNLYFTFFELPTVGKKCVTNWSLLSNRNRRLLNQPIHIFIRTEEMLYPSIHKSLGSQDKAFVASCI